MEKIVRKSNKENAKPGVGTRKPVVSQVSTTRDVLGKSEPLHSKNSKKEQIPKEHKEVLEIKPGPKTSAADAKRRQTLTQAFHTQQSVRHKKLVREVQNPPSTLPPKTQPGTYKGRVVQSKVDCFRKPSGNNEEKEMGKKLASKQEGQKLGTLSKFRSKSVTALSRPQKPAHASQPRPKSVSEAQSGFSGRPVQKFTSQRSRPAPVPVARPASGTTAAAMKKKEPVQSSKPYAPLARAHKPVTSTISQYKLTMDTAEERRAKLAEWLAMKGKTLKRPPMGSTLPPQPCKPMNQPKAAPKPTCVQAQLVTKPKADNPAPDIKTDTNSQEAQVPECKPTPKFSPSHIMNTTLDLLDNSDMDLPVDPEIKMDGLVLNLCNALEAMETPSSGECDTQTGKGNENVAFNNEKIEEQVEEEDTIEDYEILEEKDLGERREFESDDSEETQDVDIKTKRETEDEDSVEDSSEDEEDTTQEMDTTPPEMGASVVKYSVKTTPFLQSVRKRIECETVPGSSSRRKSAIKDLKFLTPVRRSSRIERKSSRLPGMLNDHDPCVSSLAELVQLDDDANAYIYRKNPALLDNLPDLPGAIERL